MPYEVCPKVLDFTCPKSLQLNSDSHLSLQECQRETTHVLNLMIPSRTVMDLVRWSGLSFSVAPVADCLTLHRVSRWPYSSPRVDKAQSVIATRLCRTKVKRKCF